MNIGAASLVALALAGCGGGGGGGETVPDTNPPPQTSAVVIPTAQAIDMAATASGEACSTCHAGDAAIARSGPGHQADYDQLYQNSVIKVSNLAFAQGTTTAAGDTSSVTFRMTKNGAAFDCTQADTAGSYWAAYDAATKTFPSDLSLGGTRSYDAGTGVCTMTKKFTAAADIAKLTSITNNADGIITLYGADEVLETNSAKHMQKAKYPFAAVLRQGPAMGAATAPFASQANVSGCENCHTQPFNKHAYIPGTVDDNTPGAAASTTQQFYVCKGCHYDQRNGGHQFWQLLQEAKLADPATAEGKALRDRAVAVDGGAAVSDAEKAKYAYKATLMNDVHMSHAMEFAYPQSMRNCVTCHDGKMDETTGIFKPANFRADTCASCHSPDGIIAKMKAAAYPHTSIVADLATLKAMDCTGCHGAFAPTFKAIHTGGYDPKIYSATGDRYSTSILAKIDSATYDSATNVLNVKFSATGTAGSYSASDVKPTIIVGLYGYNTKDFIVPAHGSAADGKRNLEHVWGDGNPRFTDVSGAGGNWEVKVDLSLWKDMIGTGKEVKRVEVAVLPQVNHATLTTVDRSGKTVPDVLGLDAPSRTFDLVQNKFDDAYYTDIINVKKTTIADAAGDRTVGCNTCHDQLATTFHSGTRGGNIRVCRLCHEKSNAGGHLELQSRSIDSYVHSIHSFQAFDTKNINWDDPFEAMEYRHHTETYFPRFGLAGGATDCESCHVAGKYGVADPSKSLPALLSASATLKGKANPIGTYPAYVTGPSATACGGCHRAQKIIEEDAGGLSALWSHWKQNGYLLENSSTLWNAVVAKVMAPFK
jgi:OmcA/MtrC family decaheme c-type cytochrome